MLNEELNDTRQHGWSQSLDTQEDYRDNGLNVLLR